MHNDQTQTNGTPTAKLNTTMPEEAISCLHGGAAKNTRTCQPKAKLPLADAQGSCSLPLRSSSVGFVQLGLGPLGIGRHAWHGTNCMASSAIPARSRPRRTSADAFLKERNKQKKKYLKKESDDVIHVACHGLARPRAITGGPKSSHVAAKTKPSGSA